MAADSAREVQSATYILEPRLNKLPVGPHKERIGFERVVRSLLVALVPFDANVFFHRRFGLGPA
jgi:hypothetical protein